MITVLNNGLSAANGYVLTPDRKAIDPFPVHVKGVLRCAGSVVCTTRGEDFDC